MLGRIAAHRLDAERLSRLIGVYRHVLGAVIFEDPADLGGAPDRPDVPHEQSQTEDALDHVEQDPGVAGDEPGDDGGKDDEQPGEDENGDRHRPPDLRGSQRLLLVAGGLLRRPGEGAEAEAQGFPEHENAPEERDPGGAVALRESCQVVATGDHGVVRLADRHRPGTRGAHHDAFDHCLSPDGLRRVDAGSGLQIGVLSTHGEGSCSQFRAGMPGIVTRRRRPRSPRPRRLGPIPW